MYFKIAQVSRERTKIIKEGEFQGAKLDNVMEEAAQLTSVKHCSECRATTEEKRFRTTSGVPHPFLEKSQPWSSSLGSIKVSWLPWARENYSKVQQTRMDKRKLSSIGMERKLDLFVFKQLPVDYANLWLHSQLNISKCIT